ncbi:trypsin-like peptidase domain-containing protein [Microcella alkalica]|uniref:Putative serine protease PepD n=1 Tax=Microcella alkalica TaxID=355930 RepID=A0A839EC34_9MICO|nr:trypsin-like peptidase domain-containing protein [Microcella alkalica]MBA8847794.1 putative serine protease PepD [Microcella alkalica]
MTENPNTPEPPAPAPSAGPAHHPDSVPEKAPASSSEARPAAEAHAAPPAQAAPEAHAGPETRTASAVAPAAASAQAATAPQRSLAPMIAALAVGALVGGAAGGGIAAWALSDRAGSTASPAGPASVTVNDPQDATIVTGVVAKAMPSVVTIEVAGGGAQGSGSGVILSEDGYVITNAHVATLDGAAADPSIRVSTSDGRLWDASLVGADPIADLAVIRIEGASGLQPIEFADSDELNVGDRAIAIGAPLGLAGTVTDGIVSALNRSITVQSSAVPDAPEAPQPDGESPFEFWNFDIPGQDRRPSASTTISLAVIQTDAAINPGNSGGALLDQEGRLMGINVAIATAGGGGQGGAGSIGVGFSIPANYAQRIATELIATGTATHGLLGAIVRDASAEASSDVVGALIDQVAPGGPAEQAGLRSGDVITEFNGVPITDQIDLTAQVRVLAAGDSAELSYVRGGRSESVTVTLGELG